MGNQRAIQARTAKANIQKAFSTSHKPLLPTHSPVHPILQLQRTIGNQAVQRLFKSGILQAKLKIGQPNDIYEQEADRVADQVMQMPEPENSGVSGQPSVVKKKDEYVQTKPTSLSGCSSCKEEELIQPKYLPFKITPLVQRQPEEEEILQTKEASEEASDQTPEVSPNLESQIKSLRGGGQPLPESVRTFFEPRFGYDFSGVSIHTDARAAESARAVNAQAFTVGRDVVLGAGEYAPEGSEGRRLLAHELTHMVQQNYRLGPAVPLTLMRKADVPSPEELEREISELRLRLAALREEEAADKKTLLEAAKTEEMLAWREALAGEIDPIRQKIIFHRARLRELREQIIAAPPSSERELIAREIRANEVELANAMEEKIIRLQIDIIDLSERLHALAISDPILEATIASKEVEIIENEAELKILKRIFSSGTAAAVEEKYKKKVKPLPGGGCMTAVYKGLEALYTAEVSAAIKIEVKTEAAKILKKTGEDTNHVDRIMETVRAHSMAGEKVTVKYNSKKGTWVPSLEKTVLDMIRPEFLGWYFFGLSVSGGYHSVILAVDNSEGGAPQIYWMDQYAKGFTKNVTGKLDKELKDWEPSYGYADTRVWPLIPTPEAVVEFP